jgi:hypothetical protein
LPDQYGTYSAGKRSLFAAWTDTSPNPATAVGKKEMIVTNTNPNRAPSDELRPVQVKQVNDSSMGVIVAAVILVVAVIGGFLWYNASYRTESTAPVVQNNTTTTAPAQPAPEAPATQPPAAPAVEPPAAATPPATPSAPATNP